MNWNRFGRPWIVFGGPLVVLVSAGVVEILNAVNTLPGARRLPAAIVRYRAAGLPWTQSDLTGPPKPANLNGASLLRAAIQAFRTKGRPFGLDEELPDAAFGKASKVADTLKPYGEAMNLAERASDLPYIDLGSDWDDWTASDRIMQDEIDTWKIANMLTLRAVLEARSAHPATASKDLLAARRLAAFMGNVTVGLMMQSLIEAEVCDAVGYCAALSSRNTRGLLELEGALTAHVPPPDIVPSLRGQAYREIVELRNFDEEDLKAMIRAESYDLKAMIEAAKAKRAGKRSPQPFYPAVREGTPGEMLPKAWMDATLEAWTKVAPTMATDDQAAVQHQVDAVYAGLDKKNPANAFVVVMFPHRHNLAIAVLGARTHTLATRAIIEALLYRCRTGRFPTKIEQLPGKWIDVLSGKTLVLKSDHKGIRIYQPATETGLGATGRSNRQAPGGDLIAQYPPTQPTSKG